jgi:hypothetical protein
MVTSVCRVTLKYDVGINECLVRGSLHGLMKGFLGIMKISCHAFRISDTDNRAGDGA